MQLTTIFFKLNKLGRFYLIISDFSLIRFFYSFSFEIALQVLPKTAVNISAMINAGMGERQVNTFLTSLNIPPITHKTLKSGERKVGKAFEASADESVHRVAIEEQQLKRER